MSAGNAKIICKILLWNSTTVQVNTFNTLGYRTLYHFQICNTNSAQASLSSKETSKIKAWIYRHLKVYKTMALGGYIVQVPLGWPQRKAAEMIMLGPVTALTKLDRVVNECFR